MSGPVSKLSAPAVIRRLAEERMRACRGVPKQRSDAETQRLIQELEIHQIELEMQNEELLAVQSELTASTAKYRELYDFAPVGYVTLTDDGSIVELNRAAATLIGHPGSELIGRRLGMFVAAGHRPIFNALLERILTTGAAQPCEIDLDILGSAGTRVRLDGVRSIDGRSCLVTLADVTATRAAEDATRTHALQFRELVESLPQQVWTAGADGALREVSGGALVYFGVDAQEIIHQGWAAFMHADDRERWSSQWQAALASGRHCEIDVRLRRSDGAQRWHAFMARPVRASDGRITMWLGTNTDVTFMRELEDQRFETRAAAERAQAALRFRDGIERMADGFVLWDPTDRLVAWNTRYETMLPGVRHALKVGMTYVELIRAIVPIARPAAAADDMEHATVEWIERFKSCAGPWETVLADGRILEIENSSTAEGGTVSILRDVTARRRHAEELERALAVERDLNAQQRRFIAIVSHEFRTPLTIIDGSAQLALARLPAGTPEIANRLAKIRAGVKRLVSLIDRILDQGKVEAGRIEFNPEPVDLGALLGDLRRQHQEATPTCRITLALPIEPASLVGDKVLLDQIFSNLISNAVKFSGQAGKVAIEVDRDGSDFRIVVRDDGIGIDADDVPRLFQRYFRARSAASLQGTGIGLHFVKEFVTLHHGSIDVRSELGVGTVVTVRLPAGRPAGVGHA